MDVVRWPRRAKGKVSQSAAAVGSKARCGKRKSDVQAVLGCQCQMPKLLDRIPPGIKMRALREFLKIAFALPQIQVINVAAYAKT